MGRDNDVLPRHPGPLPEEPRHGNEGEFSVYQYFNGDDNQYECVRRHVNAEEAVKAATHYTDNVAARMGLTHMVRITDGGDFICFEWQHGKGIVFGATGQEAPE